MSRLPAPDRNALSSEDQAVWDRIAAGADRELVILVTAREMEARYGWARHEHRAHEEGTPRQAVDAVRTNGPLDALSKRDRLVVETARALLRTRQLIELVGLAGHYSLIGLTLGAFEVPRPDDLPAGYTF